MAPNAPTASNRTHASCSSACAHRNQHVPPGRRKAPPTGSARTAQQSPRLRDPPASCGRVSEHVIVESFPLEHLLASRTDANLQTDNATEVAATREALGPSTICPACGAPVGELS